jgi:hypothetical protein
MKFITKYIRPEWQIDLIGLILIQILPVLNIVFSNRYEAINKPWFFPDKWLYLVCWMGFSWGFIRLVKDTVHENDEHHQEVMRVFYLMWGVYLAGSIGFLGFGLGFIYIFMSLAMSLLFVSGYKLILEANKMKSLPPLYHSLMFLWLILSNIAGLYMLFNLN